jgi:hypothetical protein
LWITWRGGWRAKFGEILAQRRKGAKGKRKRKRGREMEELMKAALSATEQRRADALRVLRGEAGVADPGAVRPVEGPLLMGIGAGAKLLGVSRATLWRACQAGRLEKVELYPGSYRVRREDLVAMAAGKKVNR